MKKVFFAITCVVFTSGLADAAPANGLNRSIGVNECRSTTKLVKDSESTSLKGAEGLTYIRWQQPDAVFKVTFLFQRFTNNWFRNWHVQTQKIVPLNSTGAGELVYSVDQFDVGISSIDNDVDSTASKFENKIVSSADGSTINFVINGEKTTRSVSKPGKDKMGNSILTTVLDPVDLGNGTTASSERVCIIKTLRDSEMMAKFPKSAKNMINRIEPLFQAVLNAEKNLANCRAQSGLCTTEQKEFDSSIAQRDNIWAKIVDAKDFLFKYLDTPPQPAGSGGHSGNSEAFDEAVKAAKLNNCHMLVSGIGLSSVTDILCDFRSY